LSAHFHIYFPALPRISCDVCSYLCPDFFVGVSTAATAQSIHLSIHPSIWASYLFSSNFKILHICRKLPASVPPDLYFMDHVRFVVMLVFWGY